MPKRYASVDIGLKRIGFCIAIEGVVLPQQGIMRTRRKQAAITLDKRLIHHHIDELIVGMPSSDLQGSERPNNTIAIIQQRIVHFIGLLAFDKPIHYIDESFSSYEAKERIKGVIKLHKNSKHNRQKNEQIDSLAAQIILERWLSQTLPMSFKPL